jgi:hypothetical protein
MPEIDAATLAPLLHSLLGPNARIDGPWRGVPLHGGFGGQGLYRFHGHARVRDVVEPWSVVLKVCPTGSEHGDPSAWDAPRREVSAYGSGFLARLPGPLVAPRCLGLTEHSDGAAWLWLENIIDERPGSWDIDRFGLAARHLGSFNGVFLAADPLPDNTWFSRDWLRRYVAAEGGAAARLEVAQDALPLLRQSFPPPVVAWLRKLWAEREDFLGVLDRLPQTFCHHDAFRRNLFARRGTGGVEQTVAIDWAFAGIGAVGADLAPLVIGSLLFFEVSGATHQELAEAALAEYMTGLRDVGWTGDEILVRLGFLSTAALLYTVGAVGLTLTIVGDSSHYAAVEQSMGRSMAEAVAGWNELWPFQIDLVEQARQLMPSTP